MIPPTDAAVAFRYRGVCVVCGTQMGKTAGLFNIGGEKIDNDAAPFLWIGPTMSNVKSVIVPQWDAMVNNCYSLSAKMRPGRQQTLLKQIGGTTVRFAWAGSATEISSQPAHTVVVDELDKCDPIPGHGDVLVQAEARISNYKHSGGIVIATSSPTSGSVDVYVDPRNGLEHWALAEPDDVPSQIWRAWQASTRHEFMVPCPHCHEYFAPRMRYLTGWDKGSSPAKAKRSAKLLHWKCETLIDEKHKQWMLDNGRAVAPGQRVVAGEVVGEEPDSEWYGIWISGLLSPWVTWGDRAYQWVSAAHSHDQETIRATINLGFGELFRITGEAPPWEDIQAISTNSSYEMGKLVPGVRMIFITVDVQKDRLVTVTRGWGVDLESWLLEREEIWGDTSLPDVWRMLDEKVDKGFCDLPIKAVAVDSGYKTEQVYTWCERRLSTAYATKGVDEPNKLYWAADVEVLRSGKKIKRGLKRWNFDHGYFKGWIHDRIRMPQDVPGAWHLPRKVGDAYCREIVNEQLMRLPSGKKLWVKSGPNNYLDCEALQFLLASIENVRYLKPLTTTPPAAPKRGARNSGVEL